MEYEPQNPKPRNGVLGMFLWPLLAIPLFAVVTFALSLGSVAPWEKSILIGLGVLMVLGASAGFLYARCTGCEWSGSRTAAQVGMVFLFPVIGVMYTVVASPFLLFAGCCMAMSNNGMH